MKKSKSIVLFLLSVIILSCFLASCGKTEPAAAENTLKEFTVEVVDKEGKTEEFKFSSDKDNLADALLSENFIAGDDGQYGIYIKTVNGIRADYDLDKAYWAISCNSEMLTVGANEVKINEGDVYTFTYTPA